MISLAKLADVRQRDVPHVARSRRELRPNTSGSTHSIPLLFSYHLIFSIDAKYPL